MGHRLQNALLTALLVLGCDGLPPPTPPDPAPAPDVCDDACAAFQYFCDHDGACCEEAANNLGPDEIEWTQDDESCADACRAVEEGSTITMDPQCVANADDCTHARLCSER